MPQVLMVTVFLDGRLLPEMFERGFQSQDLDEDLH